MRLLLDTQILLWALSDAPRLSAAARAMIDDRTNTLLFSSISVAEVAIKSALGKPDFLFDPYIVRDHLIDDGYLELAFVSNHALALSRLPTIHKDPFDRMLIAQAIGEGVRLLSADGEVARYGAVVLPV